MVKFNIHKNFLFCFICWTESSSGPDLKTEKHNWMLFSIHLVLVLQKRDISLPIGSKTTWGGHHQVFLGLTTLKLSAIVSITQNQTLHFLKTWTIYLEKMSALNNVIKKCRRLKRNQRLQSRFDGTDGLEAW